MIETLFILYLTSIACGSLGSILVVKNQSMIADALSHSILLGIVLGFFLSQDLDSPLLVIGAALFGVFTVVFINQLIQSPKINHDTATGLVFPLLFSIAVILISMFAKNVHLDIDMVLMGEIIFAPLHRTTILGISLPVSMVQTAFIVLINLVFLIIMYQRLKLFLFDETQAKLSGIRIHLLQLVSMLLVAITTVVSFNAVGSITVICFFVAPTMIGLFSSTSYKQLLIKSIGIGLLNCTIGFILANWLDVTISGMCTFISLMVFLISIAAKKHIHLKHKKTSHI